MKTNTFAQRRLLDPPKERSKSVFAVSRTRTGRCLGRQLGRLVVLALAAFLSASCTTLGPDFEVPQAPVAEEFYTTAASKKTQASETEKSAVDYANWWKVFNDPILDSLIKQAYEQNLTLQTAGLRILEARAQLGIARGSQYPQVQQVGGELTRNNLSENSANFSPTADDKYWDASLGFDAAWELDFWGRFRRAVESADANYVASVANYDDILVTLTAEVARTYVTIRTLQELLKIAQDNIQVQARSLRIAEVRFENGAVSELDVAQARTLLRDTEAEVPRLKAQIRQAQNALSTLLGQPPKDLDRQLGVQPIPSAPRSVAVGIPADLLRRRPDVRRAELSAASQNALIGFAETDLYPRFTLFGALGLRVGDTGSNDLSNLFEKDSLEFFGGPQFTWDIFNYGRLKNNVRVQDARLQQSLLDFQNTVLSAVQEVEDGLVEFLRSQERAGFLADAVTAAQRSVDLALIQYRDGAVDFQRVLDTQRAQLEAQQKLTSSQGDTANGLVATYKALGGGWERRMGDDFVPEHIRKQMAERTDWGDLLQPAAPLEPPPPAKEQPLFPAPDW